MSWVISVALAHRMTREGFISSQIEVTDRALLSAEPMFQDPFSQVRRGVGSRVSDPYVRAKYAQQVPKGGHGDTPGRVLVSFFVQLGKLY